MRLFLLLTISLILSTLAYAQPGYQGKKLSVGYNFAFSPTLLSPNYNGNRGFTSLAYNAFHSARIDYVVTRKSSVGFIYTRTRTAMEYELYVFDQNIYEDQSAPLKLFVNDFGLNYRMYGGKPGNIAPVGKYFEIEGHVLNVLVYDSFVEQYADKSVKLMATIGFGKQRVFFDRLLFDYGLKLGLVGGGLINAFRISSNGGFIKERAGLRLFSQNLINLRLGIGFLAK